MSEAQIKWMVGQVKTGRISRREFVGRAGALGVGVAAAATMLSSAGIAEEPVDGGILRVGTEYSGPDETFNPTRMTSGTDIARSFQVYNRLTALDRNINVVPNLATQWESANDAQEWTFELREGVEFHNGKTMTSEDVLYSFEMHMKEGSESPSKPYLSAVTDLKADGPNVVTFTLNSGNADFPVVVGYDYHMAIVPAGWTDADPVTGTGPYQLTDFTPGRQSLTERFGNYWKSDAAHFSGVETQGIADSTVRTAALRSGDIDIVNAIDPRTAGLLEQDAHLSIFSTPSGAWFNWPMMCDRAPTSDINFRKAMRHAVDRQYLVDNVRNGYAVVANDFPVNPASPDYCHEIPQHEYDPDKAAYYWKKTGLSSATLVVSNAANVSAVDLSVVLQEHARACGIEIILERVPEDGYWSDVWMQVPWCADGWSSRPTADLVLTIAHQCDAAWNETAWCNERFDELLVMGRKETDPARRKEIYCEACTLLHDEGGNFIPFFSNYLEAANNRVRNYQGSPVLELGNGWIFEEAWIDDSEA